MNKVVAYCLGIMAVIGLYATWKFGARSSKSVPDITQINVQLNVQRLEQALFQLDSKEAVHAFLQEHRHFTTQFLGATSSKEETHLAEQLYAMIKDPHMQALYQEVQRVFGNAETLKMQLTTAFRNLKYYYPNFEIPQVATFVSGMGTDLFVSKKLIVIGLDFFMGEGAKFRPIGLPDYLLRGYQPTHIAPKICLLLSQRFLQTDATDATLLADMLYYGKAYYFAQALLPQVEAHLLLDYTVEQLTDVAMHKKLIWEHFIENELLYTTNHLTKHKYIDDRPFVAEIGPRCPGRIGRWLGWEIIKHYMDRHKPIDLPLLMRTSDTQKLFSQSGYKPEE